MTRSPDDFDAFVIARGAALLRFASLLTQDAGLAEDLVQDALVKVAGRWKTLIRKGAPDAYLRRVILNEYLSWKRRRSSTEVPAEIADVAQPDQSGSSAERDALWRVLSELPARQRAVLVLRYYEDLPDTVIADLLGIAPGTVRSLASRAYVTLRAHPLLATTPAQPVEVANDDG
jgi:RNA polymerase sigma-70 factor (sigma-E family)